MKSDSSNSPSRNHKLSIWLKASDGVLIALVAAFYTAVTLYGKRESDTIAGDIRAYGPFIFITALFSLAILIVFWLVAGEIGKGNSFSAENEKHFKTMGIYSLAMGAGYLARGIYIIASGFTPVRIFYCILMLIVCVIFMIICRVLAALIGNASEIKQENDLTI